MKHQEHITKIYTVDERPLGDEYIECDITCSCGITVFGSGLYDETARRDAQSRYYEHLHAVRANRLEMAEEAQP